MNKFKIAIISDSHLIKNSPFLGIDTFKSFKAIIDNLVNGASGQAIQNMNLIFNFKENESLL